MVILYNHIVNTYFSVLFITDGIVPTCLLVAVSLVQVCTISKQKAPVV